MIIGTLLYSIIVSVGFVYAGFRSFQALKFENDATLEHDSTVLNASDFLDGGGSLPPPPDGEDGDENGAAGGSMSGKIWLRFWIVCGVLRVLATVFSTRFEDLQILLVLSLVVEGKSQDLILWFYTTFAEPGLKRFDSSILPYLMKFYTRFLSSWVEFTRRAHSFIVQESLKDISDDDLDELEISLQTLAKVVTTEKRKRRIADFKLSQERLSSVAAKYAKDGDRPPPAPQSGTRHFQPPMMEINLDEEVDDGTRNDPNTMLRRRHRGSATATKQRRQRATMGVSPYMEGANRGPLYKD